MHWQLQFDLLALRVLLRYKYDTNKQILGHNTELVDLHAFIQVILGNTVNFSAS